MNVDRINSEYKSKNILCHKYYEKEYAPLLKNTNNEALERYFQACLPEDEIYRSYIYLFGLETMLVVNFDRDPWNILFQYGFISIAGISSTSIICIDANTMNVFYADGQLYGTNCIFFYDPSIKSYSVITEYSYENILKSLIHVSGNLETYLIDVINDKLGGLHEKLDSGEYNENGGND